MADFERALAVAQSWVGSVDGVVAVGQGERDGAPCIDVWVTVEVDRDRLPDEQDGVPVVVRDSGGPVLAQDDEDPDAGAAPDPGAAADTG